MKPDIECYVWLDHTTNEMVVESGGDEYRCHSLNMQTTALHRQALAQARDFFTAKQFNDKGAGI